MCTESRCGLGRGEGQQKKPSHSALKGEGQQSQQDQHVSFQSPLHSAVALVDQDGEDNEEYPEGTLGVLRNKKSRGIPKCSKLKVTVLVTWADGTTQNMEALVDTGAEVNLVNPRVVSQNLLLPSKKPVRLVVANSHLLQGGAREVSMELTLTATQLDTANKVAVVLP